jgi:ATP phosphoribosyltransferase regulatory subunit HisZ
MTNALLSVSWQESVAALATAASAMSTRPTGFAWGTPEEQEFDRIVGAHSDAVRQLVATPAPDLFALQTKLHLLMDFEAVESDELRAIVADVDRLAAMSADFDPAKWLTDFEAAGGGFIIRDGGVVFVIPTLGEIGTVQQLIDALDRCPDDRAAVIDRIHQRDRSTISEEEGGN